MKVKCRIKKGRVSQDFWQLLYVSIENHQRFHRAKLNIMDNTMFIGKCICIAGTKWCGPSNIAKSDDDLGENRETDKCCREHDKNCKARIKGFRKNYYLWNLSWKTASHCDCEKRFKDCLNSVSIYESFLMMGEK